MHNPEIKLRIDVAVAAYAYEFENVSLVDDAKFDAMCRAVRPGLSTGNERLDTFFREKFQPHTGQWVHDHPDIPGLRRIFMIKTKPRIEPSDRAKFDMLHSTDLFGPIYVEPVAPGPNDCQRCGGDVTKNPINGGCHC
jgi:hypothetical protein